MINILKGKVMKNELSINNEQRIVYLDVLKTIAIFMVIFVHYTWISNSKMSNVACFICIIEVPLFFMINGALLFDKELDLRKHIRKTIRIICALVFWKILILLICVATKRIDTMQYNFFDYLLFVISNSGIPNIPTEHFWFLYALIKIYAVFPFVYIIYKKHEKSLLYILICLLIFTFGIELLNDCSMLLNKLWNLPKVSFNTIYETYIPLTDIAKFMCYFIIGFILHKKYYVKKKQISIFKKGGLMLCFMFGLFLIFVSRYIQVGSFFGGNVPSIINNYGKVGTLLMTISVFVLFSQIKIKKEKIRKFFYYIGSRTINIYYIHMPIAAYALTYVFKYFNQYSGVKLNFLRSVVILVLSIIITEIIKKIPIVKKVLYLS